MLGIPPGSASSTGTTQCRFNVAEFYIWKAASRLGLLEYINFKLCSALSSERNAGSDGWTVHLLASSRNLFQQNRHGNYSKSCHILYYIVRDY